MTILHHSIVSTAQQVEALAPDAGLLPNGKSGSAGLDRRVLASFQENRKTFSMLLLSSVNGYIPRPAVSHCVPPTGSHRYFALTTPTPLLTSSSPVREKSRSINTSATPPGQDEKRHGQVVGARKPMRERQKARLQLSSLLHSHCLLRWYIDSFERRTPSRLWTDSPKASWLTAQKHFRQWKRFATELGCAVIAPLVVLGILHASPLPPLLC
ncbi:uncharacterized protein QC763_200885 [Podospora pseudopauciseta]|uniref:Uncharacterized protein n=1 Tax=Podospora pseudopauciseta TaxID=2093780 RepID=A0ABR0HN19_9PEZI|nr:hypothetical protein QC763_200885 [Podospora pseudopauciseta]